MTVHGLLGAVTRQACVLRRKSKFSTLTLSLGEFLEQMQLIAVIAYIRPIIEDEPIGTLISNAPILGLRVPIVAALGALASLGSPPGRHETPH